MTDEEAKQLVETYVTFGVQYEHEEHPQGDWITPKGYVTIVAESRERGRELAFKLFGSRWAFEYGTPPEPAHHPKGELARFIFHG